MNPSIEDVSRTRASAKQKVIKVRRDYNTWVADETLEDYALRFAPRTFRKWSEFRVANTAFSSSSFLVLEAIGGGLCISYGFTNAFWAILAAALIIFLTSLPISYTAAKYGVDMDLLTRGAGFGYIGSTMTSFVYASFTFILFALEAAIMGYALEMYFEIPLGLAYLFSALIVIPLVTHGITLISRIQMITQPLWLGLMFTPILMVLAHEPELFSELSTFAGKADSADFNIYLFGLAVGVGMALIAQVGEQVDFLRFMPDKTRKNPVAWHLGVILSGPGWIIMGAFKMLVGAIFAYLIARHGLGWETANNPTHMYLLGYSYVFHDREWMMLATVLLVCISQVKINITNAYAGSLAWSNFFSRLTHSHPGRVVWTVFNALIAIMLMEMSIFRVLEQVLGLFSNIAISWIAAVVADLVVNKPLGLSPRGIEFKRAYLYDINPVGVGAMLLASILSISAFLGLFGEDIHSFSAFIALGVAFVSAPIIAWLTKGKYYIARKPESFRNSGPESLRCSICEKEYEQEDMAFCKAYQGPICSLCCTLDARCNDLCKPAGSRIEVQVSKFLKPLLPRALWHLLDAGLGYYLFLMVTIIVVLTGLLGMIYYHQYLIFTDLSLWNEEIRLMFLKIYVALIFLSGIIAWWLVLTHQSRRVAQEESNRQTGLLMQEIESHHQTDAQLQEAKRVADQASEAKSRYISSISHELRTPLNSILGYAQLLDVDQNIPPHRRQAVSVIRRSGDHLLSLIDTTLDIARIEGGHVSLNIRAINFKEFLDQIVQMFSLQAQSKGLEFRFECFGDIPMGVRADKRRLGQVLINMLANAIKFTDRGYVVLRLRYAREMAVFEIEDSGPGIKQQELSQIFEPFKRGSSVGGGTGLGLTVSKMLINLMGGELNVTSTPGQGATFKARLFLPEVRDFKPEEQAQTRRTGYLGATRRILIVDNEKDDREFLARVLEPLGFEVRQAQSGSECLEMLRTYTPDLILMDLAMPGIDGWEALRLIRQEQLCAADFAIISANAFEQGQENDVGITKDDFIVKPVQIEEFLDWMGRKLRLTWKLEESLPLQPVSAPAFTDQEIIYPPAALLHALEQSISIGFVRGILGKNEEIVRLDARYQPFCARVGELIAAFQMKPLADFVRNGLKHVESSE